MIGLLTSGQGYSHGHLHPGNILVNSSKSKVRITDIGLTFLKKYCSHLIGYTNKSAYTPPEKLTSKGSVVEQANESSDVYSIGLMLWEVYAKEKPFGEIS